MAHWVTKLWMSMNETCDKIITSELTRTSQTRLAMVVWTMDIFCRLALMETVSATYQPFSRLTTKTLGNAFFFWVQLFLPNPI